jgi:hypothetical protein
MRAHFVNSNAQVLGCDLGSTSNVVMIFCFDYAQFEA